MGDMQTTFVMIKPDGVQRGLVADIIGRFETKGLRMVGLRQLTPSLELAETHYEVHKERPFYGGLIEFIPSGPVVAMAWTGVDAISVARKMIDIGTFRYIVLGVVLDAKSCRHPASRHDTCSVFRRSKNAGNTGEDLAGWT